MKKISYKIAIPIITIVLALIVLMLFTVRYATLKNRDGLINKHLHEQLTLWHKNIDEAESKCLGLISYIGVNPDVITGFEIYNKTHDIDKAAEFLKERNFKTGKYINEITGTNNRIHFHTKDMKSLYRSWTDKHGDDLSGFRKTVEKVIKTNKAVTGIEVGRSGTVIRGIAPVRDSLGELIGSVETFLPLKSVFLNLETDLKSDFAFYLNKAHSDISDQEFSYDKNSTSKRDYKLVITRNDFIKESELSDAEINELLDKKMISKNGQFMYSAEEISDFSGETIGLVVYRYDYTVFNEFGERVRTAILILSVVILLLLISLIYFLLRYLVIKPLQKSAKFANAITQGNYEVKLTVKSNDEMGNLADSLNKMLHSLKKGIDYAETIASGDLKSSNKDKEQYTPLEIALSEMKSKLNEIIKTVSLAAYELASGSEELSQSISVISSGANEQAATTEEISAAIEQMTATISQNADSARKANKISEKSAIGLKIGQKSFENTMKALADIAKKIDVINDIAEKTDILAINAAIEATRAGEHGKGFAVVAQEIRNLAEESQKASVEIGDVIKESIEIGQTSSNLLLEIVPKIEETAILIQEISVASNEQELGANQINNAIQEFTKIIQENTMASEEILENSSAIAGQAENLRQTISFFKTDAIEIEIDAGKTTFESTEPEPEIQENNNESATIILDDNDSLHEEDDDDFEQF